MKKIALLLAVSIVISSTAHAQPAQNSWLPNKWLWAGIAGATFVAVWVAYKSFFKKKPRSDDAAYTADLDKLRDLPNSSPPAPEKTPEEQSKIILANYFNPPGEDSFTGLGKFFLKSSDKRRRSLSLEVFIEEKVATDSSTPYTYWDVKKDGKVHRGKKGTVLFFIPTNTQAWVNFLVGSNNNQFPMQSFIISPWIYGLIEKSQVPSKDHLVLAADLAARQRKEVLSMPDVTDIVIGCAGKKVGESLYDISTSILDFIRQGSSDDAANAWDTSFPKVDRVFITSLNKAFHLYNGLVNNGSTRVPLGIFYLH